MRRAAARALLPGRLGRGLENLDSVEDFICEGAGGGPLHPSAPMAAKPRPHILARAADRSSVRTPPPPPPIPGKVRVTPDRTGGPSHRYVVAKNKLWFANAPRTPPPQTEPTRPERHRHPRFSRPYARTETATKCQDRRSTISLDWNNCVDTVYF